MTPHRPLRPLTLLVLMAMASAGHAQVPLNLRLSNSLAAAP